MTFEPQEILDRSLRRDHAFRVAGRDPGELAVSSLVDFINEHKLFESAATREWLMQRALTDNQRIASKVVAVVATLTRRGDAQYAVELLSALLAIDEPTNGAKQRENAFSAHSMLRHDLDQLFQMPGIVSTYPNTWGTFLVRLLCLLLHEEQHKRMGDSTTVDEESHSRYEYHFHYMYFQTSAPGHDAWVAVAQLVEKGLTEAVASADSDAFGTLADVLIASKWGLAICLPLGALYDHIRTVGCSGWQPAEALRLLCLSDVERTQAACSWRRLLRREVMPHATEAERAALLSAIRESHDVRLKVNELADIEGLVTLSAQERKEIEDAREAGEVYDPSDIREIRHEARHVEYPADSSHDGHVAQWPHSEDHVALKLLTKDVTTQEIQNRDDAKLELFQRLSAMSQIAARQEVDSPEWFGEILGYCKSSIEAVKKWRRSMTVESQEWPKSSSEYLSVLEETVPWWESRVTSALRRLQQRPPEAHWNHEQDQVFLTSNDPIAAALTYLDEVLASPQGTRLDEYRSEFYKCLCQAWAEWPRFTRALALTIVRPYHWAQNNELTALLMRTLETATHSFDVNVCLNHLLRVGKPGVARLMRSILARVDVLTDPADVSRLLGSVVGNAIMRCRGDQEKSNELSEIAIWFDELQVSATLSDVVRAPFIGSILWSARKQLGTQKRLTNAHAELWLALLEWGLNQWNTIDGAARHGLPVLPMQSVKELAWTSDQQTLLVRAIALRFVRMMRDADLGTFGEIHYDLKKVIALDELNAVTGGESKACEFSDETFIELCRASADRVAAWWGEGMRTNDLGYVYSLAGTNTSELIMLVFQNANDREAVRRALAPIIDTLADAGLRETAIQLRSKLRAM